MAEAAIHPPGELRHSVLEVRKDLLGFPLLHLAVLRGYPAHPVVKFHHLVRCGAVLILRALVSNPDVCVVR